MMFHTNHTQFSVPNVIRSRWSSSLSDSSSEGFHNEHLGIPPPAARTSAAVQRVDPAGWIDPALKQIDEVANSMDLDLQIPSGTSATPSTYLVLDTNVLLGQLDVVQQFTEDVETAGEPITIVIPGVVVQELDYQKSDQSRDLRWSARLASTWILSKLKERKVVKGQAYQETLQRSGSWRQRDSDTSNDDLIVDCCLYFRNKRDKDVLVVSQDHNLCNVAEAQGVPTINPRDHSRWSSRALAKSILGDVYPLEGLKRFSDFKETFRPRRFQQALNAELGVKPVAQTNTADDGMDVDDESLFTLDPPPQHLLDDLHDQVLEHFTIILSELLRRVAPDLFRDSRVPPRSGAAASIYASPSVCRPPSYWKARNYLEHLCNIRRFTHTANRADKQIILDGSSRLAAFFTPKYDPQGRSGQHWSRADWLSCLGTLRALGRVYEDNSILNSLSQLDPQVELVFQTPMRPTGTGGFFE